MIEEFVVDELLTESAFPHPVTHLIKRETHISWVILTGAFAYKIKKAVRLDFIDCTALSTRQRMCEQEVALNRRLAPDLYLGVVAITRTAGALSLGGSGEIVEYAVKMQEFPESQELASLLDHDAVSTAEISDLARCLGAFHERAPVAAAEPGFALTERLCSAVLGNLGSLLANLHGTASLAQLNGLIDWTHDAVHTLLPVLRQREREGLIREGHGDLHSRNIVRWRERLVPFDCLEFDPALRWIDVMNDISFLFMDLIAHDRADLAFAFLNGHLEVTGDYAGLRLLRFYAIYRALVRAKVDSISAGGSPARHAAMQQRMCGRVATAVRLMNRPAPVMFMMHGPSGSGKSWLSERLAAPLEAVRIRSDVERKRLAGLAVPTRIEAAPRQGIYDREFSRRTYAHLLSCAEGGLEGGISIIVDAAFLDASERRTFEEFADRRGIPVVIVSCGADPKVLTERIKVRQAVSSGASDAGPAILAWQLKNADALTPAERTRSVFVNTEAQAATAAALLDIGRHCEQVRHGGFRSDRPG
ncbi:MAG TPA: AAA family ATPase [Steroidobacteraceae bacterium]|nr:AAA family ATPase [Steroidobacteraceae bacterium]